MAATIDLKLNPTATLKSLKRVDDLITSLKANVDRLNAALGQTVTLTNAVASANKAANATTRATAKAYNQATTAATKYANAAAQAANVTPGSAPSAPGNAGGARRGGGRAAPYRNPYLAHLIGSTRVGVGHFAPLLGRLVPGGTRAIDTMISKVRRASSIGGPGAGVAMAGRVIVGALGPVGAAVAGFKLAVGIAVAGVKILGAAAASSAESIGRFTHAATSGGREGQAASVRAGEFFGLGPDVGRQIGLSLSQGFGLALASKVGVNPVGGPFGDIDYNKKLIKVLEYIGSRATFEDARRAAELVGAPNLAKVQLLSASTRKDLLSSMNNGPSMAQQKSAAEYDAKVAVFNAALENVKNDILVPIMEGFGEFLLRIGHVLEWMHNLFVKIDNFNRHFFGGEKIDKEKATKANTDALNRNTDALGQGTFGGGPRARNSYPSKILPGQQDDARRRLRAGLI